MAEYGNNYDFGESPFYKDDDGLPPLQQSRLNLNTDGVASADVVVIPFQNLPSFTEEVTLDEVIVRLKFSWNSAGSCWILDVLDSSGNMLLSGVTLLFGVDLMGKYHTSGLPGGNLFVVDKNMNHTVIGKDDFINGRGLLLVYVLRSSS